MRHCFQLAGITLLWIAGVKISWEIPQLQCILAYTISGNFHHCLKDNGSPIVQPSCAVLYQDTQQSIRYLEGSLVDRSRPNQIAGPGPKSGPAGKSESRGPENGVSRWRWPNLDIYSQNHHFGLIYDMIYQFLSMDAKNYKFGMFCQQCHPSVASGDADIRQRNASRTHTRHLFTS